MKRRRGRKLLALLLLALLALCGCGRKEAKAPEAPELVEGELRFAEPSATAVPVDQAATTEATPAA